MERNVKYLIIGAGISGLTFANYADGDYLIVERSHMDTVMVKLKQISLMQNLSNYLGNV